MSLELLGVPFEHHFVCEFDKYAIQTYNDFHNTNFDTSDVSKITAQDLNIKERENFTYMMFYSFPCQSLSLAGKRQGMEKGSGTRSGLLWEVERLILECGENKPQILVMENVPQVLTSKGWREWCAFLEKQGYSNYCDILNAKDFEIPQSRNRAFMVSILGEYNFKFPRPMQQKYFLGDLLDSQVEEKYYLSEQMKQGMMKTTFNTYKLENKLQELDGECATILARFDGCPQLVIENDLETFKLKRGYDVKTKKERKDSQNEIDFLGSYSKSNYNQTAVVGKNGIAPTVTENHGQVTAIVESVFTEQQAQMITEDGNVKRYLDSDIVDIFEIGDCVDISFPNGYNKANRVFKGYAPALNTTTTTSSSFITKVTNQRIRKFTPRECFRLMGVPDDRTNNLTVSNAQAYKQAGNSIVTTCLMAIFGKLLGIDYETKIYEFVQSMVDNTN